MYEQIAPHIRFYPGPHNMPCGGHIIICGGINGAQDEIKPAK